MASVPGITDRIISAVDNASKSAYSQAYTTVFLVSIAFGGLAIIAALASVSVDDKLNNKVAAKLAGYGSESRGANSV